VPGGTSASAFSAVLASSLQQIANNDDDHDS
jgi:formiminotetrahydrofolate cyclodeaminase